MDVWNQDASQLTFQEWRSLLSKALGRAQRFELHCWKDECSWTRLALGYGSLKPVEWEGGVVVEGPVTDAFRHMLLTLERPTDREAYNKFTPFFSIVLDGRAFFEHYGTELTFLEKE
ncbi:MAG: hypothetical protein ACLU5C_00950 [Acutalibacter sp.]